MIHVLVNQNRTTVVSFDKRKMAFQSILSFALLLLAIQGHAVPRKERDASLTLEKANEYIAQNKGTVNQTYRLNYHLMAPIGWINDPNGFVYFKGEYHLFYQYNPYSSVWDTMHWGHAKSKDLIHWEELPVAFAPDQDYDRNGVFSGSAIEKDGKLYVMYTGVYNDRQVQCIAVSEDGINFEKIPQNPVLDESKLPPNALPQDFRDPRVFQRGDSYYSVIVSKTVENTGQVLLYQSNDLINWDFKSILLEGTKEQGIMWECPDLFEIGGKDVLILSLIQIPRSGNDYHNIDSVVEFIGKVNWETGKFEVEAVKELDHGMDFYATQTILDDKNRRVAATWMNMWGRNFPTHDLGHRWTGGMTLPREFRLENGYLAQAPIAEVNNVLQDTVTHKSIVLNNQIRELDGIAGDVAHLDLVVNLSEAQKFTVELRVGEGEKTTVSYDTNTNEVGLDRTQSGIVITGDENPQVFARKIETPLIDNRLKLRIFLDKSSVEVFVNDGVETLTSTVYPSQNSNGIRFGAEGRAVIENLQFSVINL